MPLSRPSASSGFVWWLVCFAAAWPAIHLAQGWQSAGLGPNPLESLLHVTGWTAITLLALVLAIAPLRDGLMSLARRRAGLGVLSPPPSSPPGQWLLRLRPQLGLWCFAYALGHFVLFLEFDLAYDWSRAWLEVREKPYLAVGALALAGLLPLAITSIPGLIRRMGPYWWRLHKLVYLVALLALMHFWWAVKPGVWRPVPATLALGGLLAYRVWRRFRPLEGVRG